MSIILVVRARAAAGGDGEDLRGAQGRRRVLIETPRRMLLACSLLLACRGDYDDGPAEEASSTVASDSSTGDGSGSTGGMDTGTGDADGSSTDGETTDTDTTDSDESTTDTETDAGMETGDATSTTGPMCSPKGGQCDFDGDCCADLCFGSKCGCANQGQECGGDNLNCCASQCIYDVNQGKSCCGGC